MAIFRAIIKIILLFFLLNFSIVFIITFTDKATGENLWLVQIGLAIVILLIIAGYVYIHKKGKLDKAKKANLKSVQDPPKTSTNPLVIELPRKIIKTLAELSDPPPLEENNNPIISNNKEDREDEDEFLDNGKQVWKGNKTISFRYKNYNGDKSDRIVDVKQIVLLDNWWYFRGYCHDRQEDRTFRADRIIRNRVTDTATGEQTTFRKTFNLPNKY